MWERPYGKGWNDARFRLWPKYVDVLFLFVYSQGGSQTATALGSTADRVADQYSHIIEMYMLGL